MAEEQTTAAVAADVTKETTAVEQTTAASSAAETATETTPAFTREQLAASKKYIHQSDLLYAVLADGKTYTIAQADAAIKAFGEKEVK